MSDMQSMFEGRGTSFVRRLGPSRALTNSARLIHQIGMKTLMPILKEAFLTRYLHMLD